jgi:hypothetical protein
MKSGLHGDGFRFMPIIQGNDEEHFPRIVSIAGEYPEVTPEQLMSPSSYPAAAPGQWMYDFSDADGPQLGTVALPGSDTVTEAVDPVAVIAPSSTIGVKFPEVEEMVVVIDRGNTDYNDDNFFAYKTPDNKVSIEWNDDPDEDWDILGKVVLCMAPFNPKYVKPKSGFLEDE